MDGLQHVGAQLVVRLVGRQIQLVETAIASFPFNRSNSSSNNNWFKGLKIKTSSKCYSQLQSR